MATGTATGMGTATERVTDKAQTCDVPPATVGDMEAQAATPWGKAKLVDEVRLRQQAGDKRFSSLVQLLEGEGGERLVRFAYATNGTARRGPVTLRERDLVRLREALQERPELASVLRL
jgi:hypothetical protein